MENPRKWIRGAAIVATAAVVLSGTVMLVNASLADAAPKADDLAPPAVSQGSLAPQTEDVAARDEEQDAQEVLALAEGFGKALQKVSLLAPQEEAAAGIEEHYRDFVTAELLEKWMADPQSAPGRTVSSPWPDRIDVTGVEKTGEDRYTVSGEIIEITSVELMNGGVAAKRPITLTVEREDGRWLIADAVMGEYEPA